MLARARKAAAHTDLPLEILAETAETLSPPAASVDTALVTYSLCTIPDAIAALEGARRTHRSGGRLLFSEHGLAPDEAVRRTQDRIVPIWLIFSGGGHLARDIPGHIQRRRFRNRHAAGQVPSWHAQVSSGFNDWGVAKAR
jgi:sirohydrochlorin ferrochelatase